jgi:hypothetical protein
MKRRESHGTPMFPRTVDLPPAHEYVLAPCPSVDGLACDACGLPKRSGVHKVRAARPAYMHSAARSRYHASGRPSGPFAPISAVYAGTPPAEGN